MKTVIISGGDSPSEELLDQYKDWYFIAADVGTQSLIDKDILPDLIIGDLDSIDGKSLERIKKDQVKVITYPKEKDQTDTHLCLLEAIRLKSQCIHILGCFGGRFDQALAHLALLEIAYDYKVPCYLIDEQNKLSFIRQGRFEIEKETYTYLSIIPASDYIDVSLYNMKYPLERERMFRKQSLGISNEILGEIGTIKLHSGSAYVIRSKDKKSEFI